MNATFLRILAYLLGFLPLLLSAQPFSKSGSFVLPSGAKYLPGTLIGKIDPAYRPNQSEELSLPNGADLLKRLGGTPPIRLFPQIQAPKRATDQLGRKMVDLSLWYEFSYEPARMTVSEAVGLLLGQEGVQSAEPRYAAETFYQPNDPYADTTAGQDIMWHLRPIQAREAWELQPSGQGVRVGIIDSGTNGEHPDLQDNWALNTDDPIDGLDNDNDGYVDNYYGWDFGGPLRDGPGDFDPSIGNVHGLWVTGIVGATSDNQIGIPGLCMNCEYLPIKAAPDDEIGAIYYGYDGIVYAIEQGAHVVNCSWGQSIRTRLGEDVVQYAVVNRGVAVVVAAGNSTSDRKFYPAAYPLSQSVANSARGDTLFSNSTYNYTVDLTAPGSGIYSTFAGNSYWAWGGTSASAPVVAGAVALTKAHFPHYTGYQAGERVRITTDDSYDANPSYLDKLGTGRVNMYRALHDPLMPAVREVEFAFSDSDGDGRFQPGDTLRMQVLWANALDSAHNLTVKLSAPGFFVNFVEFLDDTLQVGPVAPFSSFQAGETFEFVLSDNLPPDFLLALKLSYVDSATTYDDFEIIEYRVNRSYLDVTTNSFHTTINSQGNIGFNDFIVQEQGLGAIYEQSHNALFEGGFLVGNGPGRVSDRIRNLTSRDNDFRLLEAIAPQFSEVADFEAKTTFLDNLSLNPLGLEVEQRVYAYSEAPLEDFVILEYTLSNQSGAVLNNVYAGIFADWDIYPFLPEGSRNFAAFDTANQLAYAQEVSGHSPHVYGMSLLTDQTMHGLAGLSNDTALFTTLGKYEALSHVLTSGDVVGENGGADIVQYISGGPFTVPADSSETIAFALMGGRSLTEIQETQQQAWETYYCLIQGNAPQLPFFLSVDTVGVGELVLFDEQNAGIVQWAWDFGDGTKDSSDQVAHSFDQSGVYEVSLEIATEFCTATFEQTVVVQPTVGLEEGQSEVWHVYPNPFEQRVEIRGKQARAGMIRFSLRDMMGRTVWELSRFSVPEVRLSLELSPVPAGMYLLQIEGEGHSSVARIWRK